VAPDAGLPFDDQDLQPLVREIERRLKACDSTSDD
jgi:hypothetical protein